MRTPTFNFDVNYCDFCSEENGGVPLCVLNCPTEALCAPEGATPENTIMGKAVIDQYQCLAFRETGCRYCFDACPYEAIEMRDGRPYIIADKCNGCGACESVCVSLKAGSHRGGRNRARRCREACGRIGERHENEEHPARRRGRYFPCPFRRPDWLRRPRHAFGL